VPFCDGRFTPFAHSSPAPLLGLFPDCFRKRSKPYRTQGLSLSNGMIFDSESNELSVGEFDFNARPSVVLIYDAR
jgi:hypothetical protein